MERITPRSFGEREAISSFVPAAVEREQPAFDTEIP
jgi:hypothetical protein